MAKKNADVTKYLASIGRRGGKARTRKKSAAARANGKRGGRPPTKPQAERHARILALIEAGKPITPPEAALHYTVTMTDRKALAWALKKWADTPKGSVERDWWNDVVAALERGVA